MGKWRLGLLGLVVAVLGLVLGMVFSVGSPGGGGSEGSRSADRRAVVTALSTTTGAQNYAFDYSSSFQPGTSVSGSSGPTQNFAGHGVVSLNPYAMVTTNSSTSSFAQVTTVIDTSDVWEFGGGNYGTYGPNGPAPGSPLSGFAESVEGSLGQELGALSMISLANPSGRLMLDEAMVGSAGASSAGAVDGTPVTIYQFEVNLAGLLNQASLSDQERATMSEALAIVNDHGYQGTAEWVSIDGAGYIREVRSVASFSDGGRMTSDSVLSNIGCAGTVMPGQPVPVPAASGCVSPDQAGASSSSTAGNPSPSDLTTCGVGQLQASVVFNQSSGELGSLQLTNSSSTPCSLSGRPQAGAVDSSGHRLTVSQSEYARAGLPPPPTDPVVLAANGTGPQAVVELDWISCVRPVGSTSFSFQFPAWDAPLTIPSSSVSPNGFIPEEMSCGQALFAVDVVRALTGTGDIAGGS